MEFSGLSKFALGVVLLAGMVTWLIVRFADDPDPEKEANKARDEILRSLEATNGKLGAILEVLERIEARLAASPHSDMGDT